MIIIDERYCKGCSICIHFCPGKALEVSKEVNSRGFYAPKVVDQAECTSCKQCELYCPDFAIFIVEDAESADG
ncbi:MAG: 4Fe-4S binding protein [Phycisphaerales bacterium]|nr:MAG: 4Fe-4S binding protein [Phycisphaerales bacterium]